MVSLAASLIDGLSSALAASGKGPSVSQQVRLRESLERFRRWGDSTFGAERFGEWECDYEDWADIYDSVRAVLRTPPEGWDDETKRLLIYAIARDNEAEVISEELTEEQLLALAVASVCSDERDAKWQLAEQLGRQPNKNEHEKLLLAFASDRDEYVRRRSLRILADMGSGHTEHLAIAAWQSGEEYQQMACLYALWRVNSSVLSYYMQLAEQDKRSYLAGMAARMRNKTGEFADR